MLDINSSPLCHCQPGFTGDQCEHDIQRSCDYYCKNDGTCTIVNQMPYCHCDALHEGIRCEHTKISKNTTTESDKRVATSYTLSILLSIGIILLIAGAASVIIYITRRRETFSHERLQENDFNNPMYQDRDAEPFTLDADKVI